MVSFVMKSQRKEVCGEGNKVWLLSTRRRRYMWAHKIRRYPIIIRLVISWTRPETGGVSLLLVQYTMGKVCVAIENKR